MILDAKHRGGVSSQLGFPCGVAVISVSALAQENPPFLSERVESLEPGQCTIVQMLGRLDALEKWPQTKVQVNKPLSAYNGFIDLYVSSVGAKHPLVRRG